MSNPLVSIVVCCHNRRDYLAQTMETVFAQNYSPVEIIVMDDGSTDGTDELIAGYGDKVRYMRQECQGIAVTRTNASRMAKGEFIAYQDDDDLMPPNRIGQLYEALCQFPSAAFATGDFLVIDAEGKFTGTRWMPETAQSNGKATLIDDGQAAVLWPRIPAVPHTTLFRTELGEKVGWFDHDFQFACSDADFLARLGRLGPVAYVSEVVSHYRRGHRSIWDDDARSSCSKVQLWEKHLKLIGNDNPELRKRLQERLGQILFKLASYQRQNENTDGLPIDSYKERGLAQLDAKNKMLFNLRTKIKLPARDLKRKFFC
ncbi:MAG: glycosyltransferase family 2 protein [Pseudomonadales bacterium]